MHKLSKERNVNFFKEMKLNSLFFPIQHSREEKLFSVRVISHLTDSNYKDMSITNNLTST